MCCRLTAIRETFEESGILLVKPDSAKMGLVSKAYTFSNIQDLSKWRKQVQGLKYMYLSRYSYPGTHKVGGLQPENAIKVALRPSFFEKIEEWTLGFPNGAYRPILRYLGTCQFYIIRKMKTLDSRVELYRQLGEVLMCIIVNIQVHEDPGQLMELHMQLGDVLDVYNGLMNR